MRGAHSRSGCSAWLGVEPGLIQSWDLEPSALDRHRAIPAFSWSVWSAMRSCIRLAFESNRFFSLSSEKIYFSLISFVNYLHGWLLLHTFTHHCILYYFREILPCQNLAEERHQAFAFRKLNCYSAWLNIERSEVQTIVILNAHWEWAPHTIPLASGLHPAWALGVYWIGWPRKQGACVAAPNFSSRTFDTLFIL